MRLRPALAGLLLLATGPLAAREAGFLARTVIVDGAPHRYVVYVPATMARRPPVILALHGAGERGDDGWLPTDVGLGHAIRQHPERWPAIVVFPQAAADHSWLDDRRIALAALVQAEQRFHADRHRVYAVGLSMGGNGVWGLAHDNARRFAAAVVVAGFAGPFHSFAGIIPDGQPDPFTALARELAAAKLPVWIVHGDVDPVVPVADSRAMAAALTAAGGDVRYHELPGVGHNSWDPAFADPALPAWLFTRRR